MKKYVSFSRVSKQNVRVVLCNKIILNTFLRAPYLLPRAISASRLFQFPKYDGMSQAEIERRGEGVKSTSGAFHDPFRGSFHKIAVLNTSVKCWKFATPKISSAPV